MSPIRAVCFDAGDVLINDTREYGAWADWLCIPQHTFSAMSGAVIVRGEDYRQVFQYFRPGFDFDAERQARLNAGLGEYLNGHDLYPMCVRACTRSKTPGMSLASSATKPVGLAGSCVSSTCRALFWPPLTTVSRR